MLNMTLNSQITEDEKQIISEMLLNKNSYNKSLFIQLMGPVGQHFFEIIYKYRSFVLDALFEQALVSAMLRVKIILEIHSETLRFSTKDLAESILEYYPDIPEKGAALQTVTDSLKRYNKHQCRSFFQHTRKNDAFFLASDINEKKGFNLGKYLEHERSVCEIEYLLKKGKCTAGDKVQEAVNAYALHRIRCIPKWKGMTLEQLAILRKTYSKLRPFFLGGAKTTRKIPDYCYENYLDCFRLIYEYVTFYTPADLLDAAYFSLDNSYALDSYISVNFINRMPSLNDFNILSVLKPFYEAFFQECVQALKKIYSYMSESQTEGCRPAADIFIHGSAEYLRERIVRLQECNKGMPFHDREYNYEMLPLNGLIFYNTLWKGYTMVPQKTFMDKYIARADEIDSEFGRLRLAFEMIGINFNVNDNEEIYNEIIGKIQSAGDVSREILITHLLKMIYQEKPPESRTGLPETSCSPDSGNGLDIKQQKSILDSLNNKLFMYIKIASGRSDSKLWEKGMAENLTYQYIYRNYFELDNFNILLEAPVSVQNTVREFLKRYDLKLVEMIDFDNCSWLNCAAENLEESSEVYKKFMNYRESYGLESYQQRMF